MLKVIVIVVIREAVVRKCSVKKVFWKIPQNSQENTCARVSFLIKLQASACTFVKKETLAQVFSCEYCKILKSTFFHRTPSVAASVINHYWCLVVLDFFQRTTWFADLVQLPVLPLFELRSTLVSNTKPEVMLWFFKKTFSLFVYIFQMAWSMESFITEQNNIWRTFSAKTLSKIISFRK